MAIEPDAAPGYRVLTPHGARVFLTPSAAERLTGMTLDAARAPRPSAFVLRRSPGLLSVRGRG